MKQIDLAIAILALFRQELTRTQIARELQITLEDLDEIVGGFVLDNPGLPFYFKDKFNLLITPIMELEDLSQSVKNKFDRQNIHYLWEAAIFSKESLLKIRGFGEKCLSEFDKYLMFCLCDGEKDQIGFYKQHPSGILFNTYQIKVLKKYSNYKRTLWASQSVFFYFKKNAALGNVYSFLYL